MREHVQEEEEERRRKRPCYVDDEAEESARPLGVMCVDKGLIQAAREFSGTAHEKKLLGTA